MWYNAICVCNNLAKVHVSLNIQVNLDTVYFSIIT